MEEVEAEDIPIVQEVRGEDEAAPPEQGCGGERCAAAEPREQEQQQEGEGATPHLTRAEGGGPEPTATEYDATGRPTGTVTTSPAGGVDGGAAAVAPPTKVRWGESTEPPAGGGEGTEPPAEGGEGTDTHEGAMRALEAARAAAAAAQHAEQG